MSTPVKHPEQVDRRRAAACASEDLDLFFPRFGANQQDIHRAKEICAGCPLRTQCLTFALKNREHGIWGGTTVVERRRLRAGGEVA